MLNLNDESEAANLSAGDRLEDQARKVGTRGDYIEGDQAQVVVNVHLPLGPATATAITPPVELPAPDSRTPPESIVRVRIEGNIAKFDRDILKRALSELLDVPEALIEVTILSVGSLWAEIRLPADAAHSLFRMAMATH